MNQVQEDVSCSIHSRKCRHCDFSVGIPISDAIDGPRDAFAVLYYGIAAIILFDGAVAGRSLISSGELSFEVVAANF